jgi:hypothetical protein
MNDLGMPNSRSLLQALQQVANEVEQETRASLETVTFEVHEFKWLCNIIVGDKGLLIEEVFRQVKHDVKSPEAKRFIDKLKTIGVRVVYGDMSNIEFTIPA